MKNKGVVWLAVWLSVLLLGGCEKAQEQSLPPRPVLVMHPQPAQEGAAMYPGEVRARIQPDLAFRVGGKIEQRSVQTGDRVKQGQLLAALDPADLQLLLQAMQAQLADAEAGVALASAELARYRKLYERDLLSQSQLDSLQTSLKSATARRQQARAALDNARNQLDYGRLLAPADGIIASTLAEAGQVVAAGQPVFTLAEDGPREVEFSIPEQGFAGFAIGQPVEVTLLDQPQQRLKGEIRELAQAADPRSRTYGARVSLGDARAELGQSARVHVSIQAGQAWFVPLSAVDADGGQARVWLFEAGDGRVRPQPVRILAYDDQHVIVEDGLQAGDWVVMAGVHLLQDGQPVRALDPDNRPLATGNEAQP
ncbi:MAG: efflux RND transporter periplasmic adaptor subunit [Thiopseudomonas sp.]